MESQWSWAQKMDHGGAQEAVSGRLCTPWFICEVAMEGACEGDRKAGRYLWHVEGLFGRFDGSDVLELQDRAHFGRQIFGKVRNLRVYVLEERDRAPSSLFLNDRV